jgi:plastocyanin
MDILLMALAGVLSFTSTGPLSPAVADSQTIQAEDDFYAPVSLTIQVGGTVTWTNTGIAVHTVTANDGSWDSGVMQPGTSFPQEFDTSGTFVYHCTLHYGMTGLITVAP